MLRMVFISKSGLLNVSACALLILSSAAIFAQRLPQVVRPEHYALTLTPNLQSATFAGSEDIDVLLQQPVDSITLNAIEITFQSVTTKVDGRNLKATVTEDKDKQQATLTFDRKLPAGRITLHIEYTGILNGELRGFYLSKTTKRNYAVTQFEATDARRAFPSFDEPAFKATFDVSLVIDKGDTAISNTNTVSDTPGPVDGEHTIRFATTPKMSTYLLAFLVGDFQCLSGESDGVPLRVCSTPDKVQLGKYALSATEYVLHYYNTYFGIKYPMPKLDMIALPDFEAGAMENFGAITYRETDLLIDEKTASIGSKKNVGLVVAHEMAHQWFGDMVTMQWWDNLWLNEGFATWMENKPVAAWHPEWNISQDVAQGLDGTLNLDAQRQTRTIRATADTPDQINQMFDGITYGKAGAVLLMVEHYLGEELFRKGVHSYLSQHMYGNATAEDFWGAQTEVSHKPVDKIMESLVAQPGEPLLTFAAPRDNTVQVTQQRFFLSPSAKSDAAQVWTMPVCMKSGDGKPKCEILSSVQQTLPIPQAPFFFADEGGSGYYRSSYPTEVYDKLVKNVESALTPEERISLLGDQWVQVRANKTNVGAFLELADAVKDDSSGAVLGTALSAIATINDRIATSEEERIQLGAWVLKTFRPAYDRLGAPSTDDTPQKKELRATLFGTLATIGRDPELIAQAKVIAQKYVSDPASVDATLAQTAGQVAAMNGDSAYFDQLQKVYETSSNPEIQDNALRSLALFKDETLAKRSLDYAVSGKVKNQDAAIQLMIGMQSRETRDLTWQYIQQKWDKVEAQLTTALGGALVGSTSGFCSADRRDEVQDFFAKHKVPASQRALGNSKDRINDCIELRTAQEPNLKTWLASLK